MALCARVVDARRIQQRPGGRISSQHLLDWAIEFLYAQSSHNKAALRH
jgi:hypothetical protein